MSLRATIEPLPRPTGLPGRFLGLLADLGGMATLAARAAMAPARARRGAAPLLSASLGQASWMIAMALPLVALVHVSFGSFLTMQAYFGATFTEATGIVVGLGLVRNVAPLLSGFIMAGLIAAKVTSDLRGGPRPGLDDPRSLPDRDVERGVREDERPSPSPGRIALARVLGAAMAGPAMALWGVTVGTLMGVIVSRSMLGQSPWMFLGKAVEMLQPVDVLGLLIKGMAFSGAAALISTFEGLRPERIGGPDAYRAAVRSVVMILVLNFTWFNLVYLAADPFGPGVALLPTD